MNKRMRGLLFPLLRLVARMRSRRFDHIVTLGYNCELAARFFQNFKFVDATLFSWAAAPTAEEMAYAIQNPEEIFAGEIEVPRPEFPLFRCARTNIRAHGRSKMTIWLAPLPPTEEFINAEREDLVSRFGYLKKKTFGYLRDDRTVLVILKLKPCDCKPGRANEAVMLYIDALKKVGARKMTFLVVCEERHASLFGFPHPDFELRTVAVYNDEGHAADLKRGDGNGWRLIFDEFRPKTFKKQDHKFKFEGDDVEDDRG